MTSGTRVGVAVAVSVGAGVAVTSHGVAVIWTTRGVSVEVGNTVAVGAIKPILWQASSSAEVTKPPMATLLSFTKSLRGILGT